MDKDIYILRETAKQLAEIAALPRNKLLKQLWIDNNMLRPKRPMVIIDQIPWHEMNVNDELTLQCEKDENREIELEIKKTIYRAKHMACDVVVDDFYLIPQAAKNVGFNVLSQEKQLQFDELNTNAPSREFKDIIKDEEDIQKICAKDIYLDTDEQKLIDERYHSIFDGIMPLKKGGIEPNYALWDTLVTWHTVNNSLYDLIDRPDFIHSILKKMTEVCLNNIDQLEETGLMTEFPSFMHCGHAYVDDKRKETQKGKTSAKNSWTFGMSQIFSTVSPQMHEEFEFPYLKPIFERYGHVYYGCCEPLDNKIELIRKYPNIRKVSSSPWADVNKMSEGLGRDYVLSKKPNPAFVAKDSLYEQEIRKEITEAIEACKRQGTPLEILLKDISTVRYQPQRLWRWAEIAMETVNNC